MSERLADTQLFEHLVELYGASQAGAVYERLHRLLQNYALKLDQRREAIKTNRQRPLDQSDAILITYGDQIRDPEQPPLRVLAEFCHEHLSQVVSGIHILPFFPYSSDDGFSVIDYRRVDPALGDWADIARLGESFRLMFDLVINHVSARSQWFQGFLADDPRYRDYFITVSGDPDLSAVARPRALPLLTRFDTAAGPKAVWTTFSQDQIDLNYRNPTVLLEMIDILLDYVAHGAELIRLDAIAYLWKEIGTSCIHLPQTHRVVQLLRAVLDRLAPWVLLITETNVPHAENLSYFGNGRNEAQLVYNFPLPPLVLHTFHSGDCRALSAWAKTLALPSNRTTFFNFLASHDGIGVNPARGILPEAAIQALVDRTITHGGLVSYKTNPDGSLSPYELNINYFDALSDPHGIDSTEVRVARFVAAHAIMLSLVGVPGIYFHSLFGSSGWPEGVAQTGVNRAINRQKLSREALESELAMPGAQRAMVFQRLAQLLRLRALHPAFHPHGVQRMLPTDGRVFALARLAPGEREAVLCLVNVTAQPVTAHVERSDLPPSLASSLRDLLSGTLIEPEEILSIDLLPYQVCWIVRTE
jgi:sucrose phosphorylase